VQVSATKAVGAWTARALFFAGLFVLVVVMQTAVMSALRGLGVGGGLALMISGAVILATVFGVTNAARARARYTRARIEAQRRDLGLPDGACCFSWKPQTEAADFPWELESQIHAHYPRLARKLGVEGYALVDFEISADGLAKNLHCLDVWPAPIFYDAAAEALRAARFRLRPGAAARFGPSYRIPFVFRIRGAARVKDLGHSARTRNTLPTPSTPA
jgi:TonB family protein